MTRNQKPHKTIDKPTLWILIIIGTILLLFVAHGYIPLERVNSNLVSFFNWTLINVFISLAMGYIILPFDRLLQSITGCSLKNIKLIEDDLVVDWFSLRFTISLFFVLELILGSIFF